MKPGSPNVKRAGLTAAAGLTALITYAARRLPDGVRESYYRPGPKELLDLVRMMYQFSYEGKSDYWISQYLREHGIKSAKGGEWSPTTVAQVLKNTVYAGYQLSGKGTPDEMKVPTIDFTNKNDPKPFQVIATDVWEIVQAKRPANKKELAGRRSANYLLQKLLTCRKCSHRMTGRRTGGKRRAYECSKVDTHTRRRTCDASQIRTQVLDEGFWRDFTARMSDAAMLEAMAGEYAKTQPKPEAGIAARLAKLRRDLEAKEAMLGDGDFLHKRAQIKAEWTAIKGDIAVLERQQAKTANVFTMPTRGTFADFAARMRIIAGFTDYKRRRAFLELVVAKIIFERVSKEWAEYEVECRIPLIGGAMSLEPLADLGGRNSHSGVRADAQRQ